MKQIKYVYLLIQGKWRMMLGVCPKCNSDAPELYDCDICCFNKRLKTSRWELYKIDLRCKMTKSK